MKRTIYRCLVISVCALIVPLARGQSIQGDQEEGFAVAPIPIVQPVTEEGAGLALVYRYHLNSNNKTSSSSSTRFGGFITGNGSWGVGAAQVFYFGEDRWRARIAGSYADVRYNFYGIGTAAGDAGESVLMKQKGVGALGELLYRFHGLWYGGPMYRFLNVKSTFRPNPQFDASVIPPDQLNVRTAGVGPRITRDSRDDIDYPRDGSIFDLRGVFFGTAAGGQLGYQDYNVSYSKYISLGSSQVLAVRGA